MSRDIVARLRMYAQKQRETKSSVLGLLLSDAADEIERLRKERDEARLIACDMFAGRSRVNRLHKAMSYARHMNWDCFEGDK